MKLSAGFECVGRQRDQAHRAIKDIFYKVIEKRRSSAERQDDILQTLIDATYKYECIHHSANTLYPYTQSLYNTLPPPFCPRRNGRALNDDEISGMLIGLLLAGQHTSSTTSAWLGFFLARDPELQKQCYSEQKQVCGENLPPITYEQVRHHHKTLEYHQPPLLLGLTLINQRL